MTARRTLLAIASALAAASMACADIIHVPGDQPTIQAGIDAAVNGDVVLVADGVYTGEGNRHLDFGGKLIIVRSENGPSDCTIDCQYNGRGFFFQSGETDSACVDGFTICHGYNARGGGMRMRNSACPTIINCVFDRNEGGWVGGGGMHIESASPKIVNCTFINNTADGRGAGIYNDEASPIFAKCTFVANTTSGLEDWGGAVYNTDSDVTFTDCVFADNHAYGGGGISCQYSTLNLTDCTFIGNSADAVAGGLRCTNYSVLTLINCLFDDNSSETGGGMYVGYQCAATLVNSTLVRNTTADSAAITTGNGFADQARGSAELSNCIAWSNIGPSTFDQGVNASYSCVEGGWSGEGNIDLDPWFADPVNGDFRLMAGSPCIDAGTNMTLPPEITEDLDGNPRRVDDPGTPDTGFGDPPLVDMGPYEFQDVSCVADVNGDAVVDALDLTAVIAAWGLTGVPEDINHDGIVNVLDLLEVLASWGPC